MFLSVCLPSACTALPSAWGWAPGWGVRDPCGAGSWGGASRAPSVLTARFAVRVVTATSHRTPSTGAGSGAQPLWAGAGAPVGPRSSGRCREQLLGGGVGSGRAIKTLTRGDGRGSESSKVAPGSPTPLPTRPWGRSSAIKLFNCIWDKAPFNGFSLPDSTYSKGVFIKVAAAKLCFCTHP